MRIAIVGSAGRGEDGSRMSKPVFDAMVEKARDVISREGELGDVVLVSGGAAWADHVAVDLYLQAHRKGEPTLTGLALFLPCPFDLARDTFADTGVPDWRTNPGLSANKYHRDFSRAMGRDTLAELREAILCGARVETRNGFHDRNTEVAKADVLIAFTWSDGDRPVRGGTLDTWKKCKGKKVHVSLAGLIEMEMQPAGKRGIRDYFHRVPPRNI